MVRNRWYNCVCVCRQLFDGSVVSVLLNATLCLVSDLLSVASDATLRCVTKVIKVISFLFIIIGSDRQ